MTLHDATFFSIGICLGALLVSLLVVFGVRATRVKSRAALPSRVIIAPRAYPPPPPTESKI